MVGFAGIPLVYQMLVGAGALAGGAVATNEMRKEIQSTIDKDPGIMDQALKSVFMGPASQLINPNLLSEIQDKKPTPTDQGQVNWSDSFKKKTPPVEEDMMKGTLFYEQTPSGIVLAPPTVGEIFNRTIDTPSGKVFVPTGEIVEPNQIPGRAPAEQPQDLPGLLEIESDKQVEGMSPAPTPAKTPGFSMPTTPDTSILNQDKPEETKNQIDPSKFLAKDKNTKQYIEATNPVKIFGNQDLRAKDYSKELPTPIEYRFDQGTYQKVYDDSLKEINDKVNVNIEDITKKFGMKAPDINLINKSLAVAQNPDERYWYQKSGGYLKNLVTTIDPKATPKDIADFIDIVSVTSGGVEPKQNLKIALGVYSDMKQNQPMLTGFKTAKSLDKYLSNKEQAINTPKFGNFTDTMKYFAGVGDREPNVVNDLQMAKLFGVKPDQLASNPELYNAMTTTMNNITKEVNKNLPEGQELQPFELQSLMWSQSRGMASNYEQVGQELIKELNDQGIDVTKDVMKPDFAERLQKTITPYKESMKATIEVGSFLTPAGQKIEKLINQYGNDPKVMDGINTIHRRHLKSLITKSGKQPSIMEEVISNVVGQKIELSRMQEGLGTYGGKANYNVIVPLTVSTAKGPMPLTDEQRLQVLALVGKNLNQAAMAASNFKAGEVTEGRMATGQIYVKGPVNQAKIQKLHEESGYDYNIAPVAGGFVGSVVSLDGSPDEVKIRKAFEKVFGKDAEMDYIDSSWKSDYVEKNNYERLINGIQKSDVSGVEGEGATRKYRRDIDSITKKIQNISSARDSDYSNFAGSNYVQKLGQSKPIVSNEESVGKETPVADNFITKEDKRSVTNNLKSQNFLDDKLMDELLLMRGGIKGYNDNMGGAFPKMPGATKAKMEIQLQKKLFDKYKINEYPEGDSPENVTRQRKEYLMNTYNKRIAAIEYITSAAYDVIGRTDKDAMMVVDDEGLPIAGAKVESNFEGSETYSKEALTITEMGSVFKNAGDQLMKDIIQRAKDEGKRFVVAEDVTSEGALQAFKNRGFRTTTTKDTKKFKGKKISRPNGKTAYQKNLVLDLNNVK